MPRSFKPLFVVSCACAVACGGGSVVNQLTRESPHSVAPRPDKPKPSALPALSAHRFAQVNDVVGPYVGREGDAALAAWAEAEGSGRALFAMPIASSGVPGKPVRVGKLAGELDLVLVRGFGAAGAKLPGQPRFALVTTRRIDQKWLLEVTAVRADGTPVWGPALLTERAQRILWLGFGISREQPLLLWAEQASGAKPGEPAALFALPVSVDAKAAPVALGSKACAWQVATAGAQAALASVKAGPNGCGTGAVTLDLLGVAGKSEKSVDLGGRAALDLDLAATSDSFVLAWSDHEQLEPRAVTAVVDARGSVTSPAGPAVPTLGEQAVISLAAGSSGGPPAFLVWESTSERFEGQRVFELSALGANGRASGAHSRLLYGRPDGGAPELAAFGGGLAALTLAPACGVEDSCDGSLPVPTFVVLDAALQVRASEPLLLDALGGRAPDLGWGLTCSAPGCFALAAPSRSPAALYAVPLPLRQNSYRAAAEPVAPTAKPRVIGSEVLLRAPAPLSQVSLGELGDRTLVGYVTDFDPTTPWQKLTKPAEDGRLEPLRARIAVRPFAASGGRALGDEQAISLRAHSLGGLGLLTDLASPKDALALWTGLDKGEPQVFLTLLGADGKRGQQRMLTRKSGDVSDVCGLTVDGGYLVSWIDERSGDAEVYATRVSRTLEKASPEQRVTTSDGAASELLLTRVAGKPYAIWADARTAVEPGWADIYGAFLRPSDAARDGGEHRLSSTTPHSFAPQIGMLQGAPILAWIEAASDSAAASVRLAAIATNGDLEGSVTVVPMDASAPRALGLACTDVSCRVVVTAESEGRGELYGFEWRPSGAAHAVRLSGLGSPGAAAVAPLVRGNFVYAADERDGQGLVRRLNLEW